MNTEQDGSITIAADGPEVHVTLCDNTPGAYRAAGMALSPERALQVAQSIHDEAGAVFATKKELERQRSLQPKPALPPERAKALADAEANAAATAEAFETAHVAASQALVREQVMAVKVLEARQALVAERAKEGV